MKIRTDFVTNSSSVSYIVTMHADIVDTFARYFDYKKSGKVFSEILSLIKDELVKNGSHVYIEGEELYAKKFSFSTDETTTAEIEDKEIEKFDLESMSNEEIWAFIWGEFIMGGRLAKTYGFGVTQVETF